jgi:serine phosphatase RsbU (regulator of sigma subunit)
VGGDYYDFVQIDGNRLGIIVGDVSGKGVSAAFYMSEVKGIFQALSRNHASPRGFLVQANNVLSGSVDKHSFISLLFAVVDTSKQEIVVSRAGHCPMLWLAATATEYIRPGGMGLGLHSGPLFENSLEERTLPLTCGDVFLLFTDGITEARLGEDEFGYERLMSMAAASRAKSALEIRDDILQAIRAFTGRDDHDDDITLVVLKWKGTANDGV